VTRLRPARSFVTSMWTASLCAGVSCEPARAPPHPTISLRVHGGPPDATVIVDDEPIGSLELVAARGVALPPGVHHVTVKAQGFFPWDREVVAKPGSPAIVLEVAPIRVPD
jgi:PEGA domain